MWGFPVSSLYLTVKSFSVSFSILAVSLVARAEPFPDAAHQAHGIDVVGGVTVLGGGGDAVDRPADPHRENGRDAEVGDHGMHRARGLHEGPEHGLAVQLAHAVDHRMGDRRVGV